MSTPQSTNLLDIKDHYCEHGTTAPNPKRYMVYRLKQWKRWTGEMDAAKIGPETFNAARKAGLDEGLKPVSIETTIGDVLTLLKYAHQMELIPRVPHRGRRLKIGYKRPYVPPLEHVDLLYRAADVTRWPRLHVSSATFWRAYICCLFFTALRKADAMQRLLWDCFKDGVLTIEASKTGKEQSLPAEHPVFLKHLETMRGGGHPRVFPIGSCDYQINREFRAMSEAAGINPRITSKLLRRASATSYEAAQAGAGGILLGHALDGRTATRFYIDPVVILSQAAVKLRLPEAFTERIGELTPEERTAMLERVQAARKRAIERALQTVDGTKFAFPPGNCFVLAGVWFPCYGAALRLLKLLATSSEPQGVAAIVDVLQSRGNMSASAKLKRVHQTVYDLRRILKKLLPIPNGIDVVPCFGRGDRACWGLFIPPETIDGLKPPEGGAT